MEGASSLLLMAMLVAMRLAELPCRHLTSYILSDLVDCGMSFLHVLAWMMLRYVPASDSYQAYDRGMGMKAFDQHYHLLKFVTMTEMSNAYHLLLGSSRRL
ncbi:hypothetical protein OG21DRAFT_910639 [Imleria badia]|nr:hypothetical protein OG21DRAFT_910639 [Imleria badia]